jgi:hypothetical protein
METYLVYSKINRTTSSITNHEVLRRLKIMKIGKLGTVHGCSLRLCNNPQTISPGGIASF